MNGRVLLDTSIVIAIFAGEPPVLERVAAAEEVSVPAVALGELYYGARKSGRGADGGRGCECVHLRLSLVLAVRVTGAAVGADQMGAAAPLW
jgi:predicted nucleic acid-binding protein